MDLSTLSLPLFFLFAVISADLCPQPNIPNGKVSGHKDTDVFFGEVSCNIGFHLVGVSNKIKCRHGVWSHEVLPLCSAIGSCPSLPELQNGRKIPFQGSRGSAFRFRCNKGFKRFGDSRTHCIGDHWSHSSMPICTKATCDETGLLDIPYGEGRSMMGGAVYKYRCNTGVEMEGSDTLVCDGDNWNGTVPHCNVAPDQPQLEVIVSGNAVTNVKPGDWVLVTCQAKGGHPLPDIGLTLDGVPAGSKDFRNYRNSFTFTASEEDEFIYECAVMGGYPASKITWTIRDHLGNTKEVAGEMIERGLSRMTLKTGTDERMLSINCVGSNKEGIVSHTMHVNTHYLPQTVQITGPTIATPGQFAHFTCVTTETFPVPALTWKIEKSGDIAEVSEIDGDVSTEALEDGGVVAFAKIDISIEETMTHGLVQCFASLDAFGKKLSKQHEIDVISLEEPIKKLKEEKTKEDSSVDADDIKHTEKQVLKKPEMASIGTKYFEPVNKLKENKNEESMHLFEDNKIDPPTIKIVMLEKEEQGLEKPLWIPLKPDENIHEYQDKFIKDDDASENASYEEEFLRPSQIPKATMLKQEKEVHAGGSNSPVSFSVFDHTSSSSTVSIQTILISMMFSVLILFC